MSFAAAILDNICTATTAATVSQENHKLSPLPLRATTVQPTKSPQLVLQHALLTVPKERGDRTRPPRAFRVPQDFSRLKEDSHRHQHAKHATSQNQSTRQLEAVNVLWTRVHQEPTVTPPHEPARDVPVENTCHLEARPLLTTALARVPPARTRQRQA